MPETLAAACPVCGHALSDHGDDPVHAVSYCRRDCGCLVGVAAKSEAATVALRARVGRCEFCKAEVVLSTPDDLSCAESPDGWHYVPHGQPKASTNE